MQNKFIYALLVSSILGCATFAWAQEEVEDFGNEGAEAVEAIEPVAEVEEITPNLDGRQPVDFPARSSMGTMELAPLPRLDETAIDGPMPMTPSISSKDFPSEQLLGRLNPEVFQELAEIQRTNTYLDLQRQKLDKENALAKAKADYRIARLEEIKQREDLIHQRIEWWQEQEKIRLDNEKIRAEAESAKNALEQAEEQKQLDVLQPVAPIQPVEVTPIQNKTVDEDDLGMGKVAAYELLSVQGTNSNLTARVRNIDTQKVALVRVGDTLATGDVITSIMPTQVVMSFEGAEYILTFDDNGQ